MNAEQVKNKTLKQSQRLISKYIKQGMRAIKKQIRDAQKHANSRALIIIRDTTFINIDVIRTVRKVLVEFLETNGFYVRKYALGHKTELTDPEEISFAWGSEIEKAREIDALQEKMIKGVQNETI